MKPEAYTADEKDVLRLALAHSRAQAAQVALLLARRALADATQAHAEAMRSLGEERAAFERKYTEDGRFVLVVLPDERTFVGQRQGVPSEPGNGEVSDQALPTR